jgi:hypothetical protein
MKQFWDRDGFCVHLGCLYSVSRDVHVHSSLFVGAKQKVCVCVCVCYVHVVGVECTSTTVHMRRTGKVNSPSWGNY